MSGRRSTHTGSTLIELIALAGMIAIMIALLIPVVLNNGEDSATQKFANKTGQKHSISQRGSASGRTIKM